MKKKCKVSSFCFIRGLALLLPLTIGIGSAIADDTVPVATDDWEINSHITPTPTDSIKLPSIHNTCMEDVSSQNGVSGLTCTANDIRIAEVFDINITDGDPDPDDGVDECTIGEDVTFTAKFQFELSAQERHDLGVWFATDGTANARTGACLVSTAPIFIDEYGDYINDLDDSTTGVCSEDTTQKCASDNECKGKNNTCMLYPDYCGDIDDATSPQYFELEITTECIDKDRDQELDLPVCLSWRQPGADEYCEKATDAYPGAPSKCNCDDDFSVPIRVPAPPLTVYKNISPATITEPGGTATVTFDMFNPSLYGNDVDISSIVDKLDNYVTDQDGGGVINVDDADFVSPDEELNVLSPADVTALNCKQYPESYTATPSSTPASFDPSSDLLLAQEDQTQDPVDKTPNFVRCTFTRYVGGEITGADTGWFFDLIKVSGVDEYGAPTEGEDDASLQVVDKPPKVNLTKTVSPTTLTEQQIYDGNTNVTYTVKIDVPSDSDTATISCLDDKTSVNSTVGTYSCGTEFDILATCLTAGGESLSGKTIAPGGSETCTFVAAATGISDTGDVLYDRVVVTVSDDEGGDASASDTASVTVTNSPPSLQLTKTGAPTGSDKEPSYVAKYTYIIKNITDFADIIVLDKLEDDITLVDGTTLATLDITDDCLDADDKTLLTAQEAPVELEKDESFTCTLTRTVGLDSNGVPAGDAPGASDSGNTEDNIATITGHEKGIAGDITATDDESLGFSDALPTATVKKEVNKITVVYKVTVSSTSNEPLDITKLTDTIGPLSVDLSDTDYDPPSGLDRCDVTASFELKAQNDAAYTDYVCYFSRTFEADSSTPPIIDTVTVTAVDDEGNEVTPKPTANAQVSWVDNYVAP